MSADMPKDDPPESLSLLEKIDPICDEFERVLMAAASSESRPRIEDYVIRVSADDQRALVRALLEVEIKYRRKLDETILPSDYKPRFRDHDRLIDTLLAPDPTEE